MRDYIPIFISIFSLLIAALALGWNIYRDVVLKARLKLDLGFKDIIGNDVPTPNRVISLRATNFGPGLITLSAIVTKNAPLWWKAFNKVEHGFVVYKNKHFDFSGDLPCKLDIGGQTGFMFRPDAKLMTKKFTHIGIRDSFDRVHWASKKSVKQAFKFLKQEMQKAEQNI